MLLGQVGINTITPNSSSALDINSSNKGMLIPRMSKSERNGISNPAHSLLIYQTDNIPGYYYNSGTSVSPVWTQLLSSNQFKIPIDTLPFNITTSGSYILKKNLNGNTGITISASNVSIDLNFYTLSGNTGNTSYGINVLGSVNNIAVYNGNIIKWGNDGIKSELASNCRYIHLTIRENGGDGIYSGSSTLVSNCIASHNTFDGIDVSNNSSIENTSSAFNSSDGIECDHNCILSGNISSNNGSIGINAGNNTSISNCTSSSNTSHGFYSSINCKLSNNTATNNTESGFYLGNATYAEGNTAQNNSKHGFECNQDVNASNNNSDSNTLNGFHSTFNGGKLDQNNASDNAIGFNISGSDWLVIRNTSIKNISSGFTISASNMTAPIITSSALLISNTNSFSNISY